MNKIVLLTTITFLLSSCFVKQNPEFGTIYGKISISEYRNNDDNSTKELFKSALLYLDGSDIASKIESNGTFYFMNVPPGFYRCKASLSGYRTIVCDSVEVNADSISLLYSIYFNEVIKGSLIKTQKLIKWHPKKLKYVNLSKRGSIKGKVFNLNAGKNIDSPVNVCFSEPPYCVMSDLSGHFEFKDLLPGNYNLWTEPLGYYRTIMKNIQVVPDSVSLVDIPIEEDFGQRSMGKEENWKRKISEFIIK